MACNQELCDLFFHDLKQYNSTNFKTIARIDLTTIEPTVLKSCSSAVTRFFIFQEKHPEVSEADMKMLYFKLRIDMVARFFSEYPAGNIEDLKPFQQELRRYIEYEQSHSEGGDVA